MSTERRTYQPPRLSDGELSALVGRLAERRAAAGLSRQQLAEAAGLTYSAIAQLETAQNVPSLGTLEALATALGCHMAELLGGRPPAKSRT